MAECILIGAPIDAGQKRAGCLMGPSAYRVAGLAQEIQSLGHGLQDWGDLARPELTPSECANPAVHSLSEVIGWTAVLADKVDDALSQGGLPIILGGDHSLALGSVSGAATHARRVDRPLFLLWLDAHSDFHTVMTTKLRYLLSGEEQYNNKTYAFHKARSPWLRFNPIGWTLIFALAMTALGLHAGAGGVRVPMLACLLIAGGVLLFYVSDRFRAPLVPVLAVLAGGICRWRPGLPLQRAAASGLIALALACFPVDYDPRETETQDHLLLATSANALGRYAEALREIDAARAPSRPAVITLRCVVGFNAWLTAISTDEAGWTADCRRAAAWSAIARLQTAHADWRAGHTREAVAGWRKLAQRTGSLQTGALAGLWQAGALDELTAGRVKALLEQGDVLLLGVAASQGDGQAARRLTDLLGASAAAREQAAVARLWGAPGAMRPRRD